MRAIIGFTGVLAVFAAIYIIYHAQISPGENSRSPLHQVDQVRVRADLIAIAQAERLYLSTNGSYGTLEELQQSGNLSRVPAGSREYNYEVETDGSSHFKITAKPANPASSGLPGFTIDETMRITP